MKKTELDKVFTELLKPNIVLVTVKDNSVIDIEEIIAIKKINLELVGNLNYGLIIETGEFTSISNEARTMMTTKEIEENRIAIAIIIHHLPQRLLANFFLRINNPAVPAKIFSNRDSALMWIEKKINLA